MICRRSDLDDGAAGPRCVGGEEATKVLSSGSSCAGDAIGRIGGDVVAISWSLSRRLVGLRYSGGDLLLQRINSHGSSAAVQEYCPLAAWIVLALLMCTLDLEQRRSATHQICKVV